jgi:hypothetical protein
MKPSKKEVSSRVLLALLLALFIALSSTAQSFVNTHQGGDYSEHTYMEVHVLFNMTSENIIEDIQIFDLLCDLEAYQEHNSDILGQNTMHISDTIAYSNTLTVGIVGKNIYLWSIGDSEDLFDYYFNFKYDSGNMGWIIEKE